MANFELVSAYDDKFASWLEQEGYPHPPVRKGNEMPTTADMKWALEQEDDFEFDIPHGDEELYGTNADGSGFVISGFDWDNAKSVPGDHFKVRGSEIILSVLIRLCQRCGQLYVYPDSGYPPIILDRGLDAQAVAELYTEACAREDMWELFFEQMFGPEGLAPLNG